MALPCKLHTVNTEDIGANTNLPNPYRYGLTTICMGGGVYLTSPSMLPNKNNKQLSAPKEGDITFSRGVVKIWGKHYRCRFDTPLSKYLVTHSPSMLYTPMITIY